MSAEQFDIITRTVIPPNTVVWQIDKPNVQRRMTEYPNIRFRPGDRIKVEAGGCVQTGGFGNSTWKRYVDPSGWRTDRLYHGLLWIPGATLPLARIRGMVGSTFEVPRDFDHPEILYLRLGYEDDAYGDNGYWGHDDGDDDQCKNVGNAYVRLTVVTPEEGHVLPALPYPLPLDLVWCGRDSDGVKRCRVDYQGLPLNPQWGAQAGSPGVPTPGLPNVAAICPRMGEPLHTATGGNEVIDFSSCTSQAPAIDAKWQPYPLCEGYGHINWGAVTCDGIISFIDYSGNPPQDGDYNFRLAVAGNAGLTTGSSASTPAGNMVLEFDSNETIDDFNSPWWNAFREAVDEGHHVVPGEEDDYFLARQMIDGRYAIVTGLFNLDTRHDIWSELHPVWALAIRVHEYPSSEVWAIFVRNWGNQGGCSEYQHYFSLPNNMYTFRLPWRKNASSVSIGSLSGRFDHRGGSPLPTVLPVYGKHVRVSFGLAPPEDKGFINGTLELTWTIPPHNAEFVYQHLPTSMVTGQSYEILVRMRNTDVETWEAHGPVSYMLGVEDRAGKCSADFVSLPGAVAPGTVAEFKFTIKAPPSPGSCNFQWRMVRAEATQHGIELSWFGESTLLTPVPVNYPDSRITCVRKAHRDSQSEHIEFVGGHDTNLVPWTLSQKEVIAAIEGGAHFYVEEPVGHRAKVIIAVSRRGHKYIKTEADGETPNNLLNLPEC